MKLNFHRETQGGAIFDNHIDTFQATPSNFVICAYYKQLTITIFIQYNKIMLMTKFNFILNNTKK